VLVENDLEIVQLFQGLVGGMQWWFIKYQNIHCLSWINVGMIEFDVSRHNFASDNLMSFLSFDVTGFYMMIIILEFFIITIIDGWRD
jgi:hypothetical protein